MASPAHGGARSGAGRPRGVPNRLPSKAKVAQEALIEKLTPHLDLIVDTSTKLLSDPNVKAAEKVALIRTLFDFINRGAAREAVDGAVEALGSATVSDLLRLKERSAGASVEE